MAMKSRSIFWIVCLIVCLVIIISVVAIPLITGQLTVLLASLMFSSPHLLLWSGIAAGLWGAGRILLFVYSKRHTE